MNLPPGLLHLFKTHLPEKSIPYCTKLWQETPFSLHVKKPRSTKLGDFRYRKDRKFQTITLNSDLNPYQFLLTYIHELAHLRAFEKHGIHHAPHGHEWKKLFQELMDPILTEIVFPRDLLVPLKLHLRNPSASSARDLFLMKEMSKYDKRTSLSEEIFLSDLTTGNTFILSGRKFRKGETRRTRIICEEIGSGKKFLVSRLAKVQPSD
jgi:hypothetical protein